MEFLVLWKDGTYSEIAGEKISTALVKAGYGLRSVENIDRFMSDVKVTHNSKQDNVTELSVWIDGKTIDYTHEGGKWRRK